MKRLIALTAILYVAILAAPVQADSSSCPDGFGCAWTDANYNGGSIQVNGVAGDVDLHVSHNSAKNRFLGRKFQVLTFAGQTVACMDPGENRPSTAGFRTLRVGELGSRCNN